MTATRIPVGHITIAPASHQRVGNSGAPTIHRYMLTEARCLAKNFCDDGCCEGFPNRC